MVKALRAMVRTLHFNLETFLRPGLALGAESELRPAGSKQSLAHDRPVVLGSFRAAIVQIISSGLGAV